MTAPHLISLDRKPALDLNYAAFEHVTHGIRVVGTWHMDPETKQARPCLVLLHGTRPVRRRHTIPCVITLDQAWRWTREIGDNAHVASRIYEWLRSGALPGSVANKRDVYAVIDAVQSRLNDLYRMPPFPAKAAIRHGVAPGIGEFTITERESGRVVHEAELTSHVRD